MTSLVIFLSGFGFGALIGAGVVMQSALKIAARAELRGIRARVVTLHPDEAFRNAEGWQ